MTRTETGMNRIMIKKQQKNKFWGKKIDENGEEFLNDENKKPKNGYDNNPIFIFDNAKTTFKRRNKIKNPAKNPMSKKSKNSKKNRKRHSSIICKCLPTFLTQ